MHKLQSADGTTIAYQHSGTGPALVFVVGAFCDRHTTASLAEGLAARYTVYEYDRRGRGDSGDTPPYAVDREIEDLAALVAEVGAPVRAYGHSSGAALVLEAAASGVPFEQLAVYEPPYVSGATLAVADELAALAAEGRNGEVVEGFLALSGVPAELIARMKAGERWSHMTSFAPTLPYEVRLCNDGTAPMARLARITAPTLAMAGGDSAGWARDGAPLIAASVAHGESRVLPDQGHGADDHVLIPVLTEFFG